MTLHETITLTVNGTAHPVEADRETPLLYVLRNDLGLNGTRFGCGEGACGACVVLVDGAPRRSCQLQLWEAEGKRVETVEALITAGHPLVEEVLAGTAGQCGYCLAGILMQAAGLLARAKTPPGRAEIAEALALNLCRCGAHGRILSAIERAAARVVPAEAAR